MNVRLAQRVKQLEGGAGMGSDMPRFILVRGIAASERKDETDIAPEFLTPKRSPTLPLM